MLTTIKELLEQRERVINTEFDESVTSKIKGILGPARKVKIHWTDLDHYDEGYIFTMPEMNVSEDDVFIHVPFPQNEEGIGDAPEAHIHILELASFDNIKQIEIL